MARGIGDAIDHHVHPYRVAPTSEPSTPAFSPPVAMAAVWMLVLGGSRIAVALAMRDVVNAEVALGAALVAIGALVGAQRLRRWLRSGP